MSQWTQSTSFWDSSTEYTLSCTQMHQESDILAILCKFFKNNNEKGRYILFKWNRHVQYVDYNNLFLRNSEAKPENGRVSWFLKSYSRGWRDGSAVKDTDYSFRGHKFDSQHPQGSLPASITLIPEDQMPSSGFHGHWMHVVHRCICRQNIQT